MVSAFPRRRSAPVHSLRAHVILLGSVPRSLRYARAGTGSGCPSTVGSSSVGINLNEHSRSWGSGVAMSHINCGSAAPSRRSSSDYGGPRKHRYHEKLLRDHAGAGARARASHCRHLTLVPLASACCSRSHAHGERAVCALARSSGPCRRGPRRSSRPSTCAWASGRSRAHPAAEGVQN